MPKGLRNSAIAFDAETLAHSEAVSQRHKILLTSPQLRGIHYRFCSVMSASSPLEGGGVDGTFSPDKTDASFGPLWIGIQHFRDCLEGY